MNQAEVSSKDKVATGLLCFFLGTLGAHNFYVGKYIRGVWQAALGVLVIILLSVGFSGDDPILGFGGLCLMALLAWVLVDFIIILANRFRDGEGKVIMPALHTAGARPQDEAEEESPRHSPRPSSRPRPTAARSTSGQRLQQRILMCAKQEGGVAMPTTVAMRTGFDIDMVKDHLESLVDKGYAELQPTKDGSVVYVFRDMLTEAKRDELELL